jgi:predicted anti-sigma-YlaC factor YlaD
VRCSVCREVVSAELDGEASPDEVAQASRHLATCAACRTFRAEATALHRAVRVSPADDVPDLAAAVLSSHPPSTEPDGDSPVWRLGLALIGIGQVLAAAAHLGGDHLARDQASWEAALAAGFLWAAWRPTRTAGLLPVTAVLTVLLLANGGLAVGGSGTHHLLAPLGLVFLVLARRRQSFWIAAS